MKTVVYSTLLLHFILVSAENCRFRERGDIRIIGTDTPNLIAGRLEICISGRWRAVYDDSWSDREAQIVCTGRGFPDIGAMACGSSCFGASSLEEGFTGFTDCNNQNILRNCGTIAPDGHFPAINAGVVCIRPNENNMTTPCLAACCPDTPFPTSCLTTPTQCPTSPDVDCPTCPTTDCPFSCPSTTSPICPTCPTPTTPTCPIPTTPPTIPCPTCPTPTTPTCPIPTKIACPTPTTPPTSNCPPCATTTPQVIPTIPAISPTSDTSIILPTIPRETDATPTNSSDSQNFLATVEGSREEETKQLNIEIYISIIATLGALSAFLLLTLVGVILGWVWSCHRNKISAKRAMMEMNPSYNTKTSSIPLTETDMQLNPCYTPTTANPSLNESVIYYSTVDDSEYQEIDKM